MSVLPAFTPSFSPDRARQNGRLRRRALLTGAIASVALAVGGCGGGGAEIRSLPIRDDFADCSGFTSNDEVATVDCPEGSLRVLVSDPTVSATHFVPFRFDELVDGLAVEADVRHTRGSSAHGLGCSATGPGEAQRGYLFLTVRGVGDSQIDGSVSIIRVDRGEGEGASGRVAQSLQELRVEEEAVVGDGAHRLRAVCQRSADGSVQLTMLADGKTVARARDKDGIGPFRAALATVIAVEPESEVVFDDLLAESTHS